MFRQSKPDNRVDMLESELMRLRGAYEFLEGQYRDAIAGADIARKNEKEAVKYLRDLETMLVSYGDRTVMLQEVENRSLKDRVKEIVEALNKMKSGYLEVIEQLRNQLSVTDQELRKASQLIEELTETAEEQKMELSMKDDEASTLRDTIDSLQSANHSYEVALQKWEQYRVDMEAYIAYLSQGRAAAEIHEAPPGHTGVPDWVATDPIPDEQSDDEAPALQPEKRARELSGAEIEGFKRLAVQYLSTQNLSARQQEIIFIIGSEGYSERIRVAKHLGLSNSTLKDDFLHLVHERILQQEEITLDGKTFLHQLSPLGVGIYLSRQMDLKAQLVFSDMECMIQDHQNVHHGYFIRDTKDRLVAQGFLEVTDDRKLNTRNVARGKQYVADITATHPETKETWYIECEHVTQSNKELTEKLLKAAQVTSRLYVVVPSKEDAERFEKFYLEYYFILKSHHRKPLAVLLGTRRQFKKGEFIPLDLEEMSLRYPDETAACRKKHPPHHEDE